MACVIKKKAEACTSRARQKASTDIETRMADCLVQLKTSLATKVQMKNLGLAGREQGIDTETAFVFGKMNDAANIKAVLDWGVFGGFVTQAQVRLRMRV